MRFTSYTFRTVTLCALASFLTTTPEAALQPAIAQGLASEAGAVSSAVVTDGGGSGLIQREYDLTRKMAQTPSDIAGYLLRPGDLVNVTVLTGEADNITLEVQLAQDGSIALPWVDPLVVEGLTLAQTSTLVQQAYSRIYRRAFSQVTLVKLGSYMVQVQGYHPYPGLYRVYNGTSLYGLLLALNIDTDGERRRVRLLRPDATGAGNLLHLAPELREVGQFDALDFSVRGRIEQDLFLAPFDRLVIEEPPVVVQIERGVPRPGKYAVQAGEGLQDILELAGQADRAADLQNTILTRLDADGTPQVQYLDLASILASPHPFPLQDRDRIRIVPYRQQVYVLGEVQVPGAYPLDPGDGVLELLSKAGGISNQAHARSMSLVRPPRLFADRTAEHDIVTIDIRTLIKPGKQREQPASLQAGDILYVPSKGDRLTASNILTAVSTAFTRIITN
ncbi:MAG: hypothetical protein GEEBNDBF_00477 [bacterium]|nr:hypothetical protein [bacterium]